MSLAAQQDARIRPPAPVQRHALPDRAFHWITAAAVLTLLVTAFLPILGVEFAWLAIHWAAGWVLIAALLFHVVRAIGWQSLGRVAIGPRDLRDLASTVRWTFRATREEPPKPGKYSLAQKLIHWLFAIVLLAAAGTGGLMMVKIDTPWWNRNPYWLSDETWGVVYVIHDFAALCLVTMVIAHVYFALRPEKLFFTRAMLLGSITREEYAEHHDPSRWRVNEPTRGVGE
jgi:cytochrome b subunit of formate dehydrogenase